MAKPKTNSSTPTPRLDHSRSLWRSRLGSALRTSMACVLVGVATLYSPTSVRRHLHFPAFSYMTAVLVVGDASSLGSSTRSAACASYGILLGLLPAMLTFYSIRPEGVSAATTALAVAISSFVVAASDSPGLITTRVALAQVVIVYVTAYKETGHVKPVALHPVPVAASTAVGAAAAVLALVFPYPKLAYHQVEEKTNLYTEMAKERLRVLVNAFCADSTISRSASEYKAKSLAAACKKFLQNIKLLQVVESALDSNDQKIDDAVQALRALCHGGMSTQLSKENAEEFQNGCPEELRNVSSWVDLLVQEIMSAAGWDDVRGRTTKFLEAFERSVLAHTTTSKEQEIASLKEQLQCFLKDNHILKRGLVIQHERNMEREEKLKEIPHLKQIISQCQEQLRKLEMDNYALKIHLQRSQQSSSFPRHFNPDIF